MNKLFNFLTIKNTTFLLFIGYFFQFIFFKNNITILDIPIIFIFLLSVVILERKDESDKMKKLENEQNNFIKNVELKLDLLQKQIDELKKENSELKTYVSGVKMSLNVFNKEKR